MHIGRNNGKAPSRVAMNAIRAAIRLKRIVQVSALPHNAFHTSQELRI